MGSDGFGRPAGQCAASRPRCDPSIGVSSFTLQLQTPVSSKCRSSIQVCQSSHVRVGAPLCVCLHAVILCPLNLPGPLPGPPPGPPPGPDLYSLGEPPGLRERSRGGEGDLEYALLGEGLRLSRLLGEGDLLDARRGLYDRSLRPGGERER